MMYNLFQITGNVRELNQAWDLYYHVFRRISRQLPQPTTLELQYVSPNLQVCQDLELAVPGSYAPGQPIVRIASFHESLEVSEVTENCLPVCKYQVENDDLKLLINSQFEVKWPTKYQKRYCMLCKFHRASYATFATKNICDVY